jgi:DNA-binding NtrC family response regulator
VSKTDVDQNAEVRQSWKPSLLLNPFVGPSPAMRAIEQKARKFLLTDQPVLIQGETGTGKGVLAAWLHYHGGRRDQSFVDLNCASLSPELLESDLFGHERGAFTGAVATKKGLFEIAHNGTVFLDEIGDLDLQVQPRLLKVLEENRFRRLGDVCERHVNIRLITATGKNLAVLVREQKFRIDLYYRINTFSVKLPALRERIEDIPFLARKMLKRIAIEQGHNELLLSPELEKRMQAYLWPGNLRELRQSLQRAAIFCENAMLTVEDLQLEHEHLANDSTVSEKRQMTLSELERRHIEQVLRIENGNVEETAKTLGLSRSALYERIKKHGISLSGIPKLNPEFGTNVEPGGRPDEVCLVRK